MIVLILWIASASVGVTIGVVFFRLPVLALASQIVAFLSAAALFRHGFGLFNAGLISVGSLVAVQGFYLLGVAMRYMHHQRVRPEIALRAQNSNPQRKSAGRSSQPKIS
jgi:hypothetical protein